MLNGPIEAMYTVTKCKANTNKLKSLKELYIFTFQNRKQTRIIQIHNSPCFNTYMLSVKSYLEIHLIEYSQLNEPK
jgi:hypothetical protein